MDELVITVGGQQLSGWTGVRLTRGIELMPSSFDLQATERYPGQADAIVIQPGNACTISIGGDLVLTGYVDQYSIELTPNSHNIQIRGRSKCEDVVDTSAGFETGGRTPKWIGTNIGGVPAVDLITTLVQPFGVTVNDQTNGLAVTGVPPFYLNIGECVYEVIERISRSMGFLCYDQPDGNLVLALPGSGSMASGFIEGSNIQRATSTFDMCQRYSDYYAMLSSATTQADIGSNIMVNGYAADQGVIKQGRFRPLAFIVEYPGMLPNFAQQRATWECNRRWGRANQIKLTCDAWRDSNGKLWQPNYFAPINAPTLKITGQPPVGKGWVISEVTYMLDLNAGTTADLTLMSDTAFSVEPTILTPQNADLETPPPTDDNPNPGGATSSNAS